MVRSQESERYKVYLISGGKRHYIKMPTTSAS